LESQMESYIILTYYLQLQEELYLSLPIILKETRGRRRNIY